MNNSKRDIIGNLQCNFKNVKYVDDDMVGVSDIGLVRKKQEDSILLLRHFLNEDFNLMAIADGMGGLANGAIASNILLKSIIDWFEALSNKYYTDIFAVYNNLISNLNFFDEIVRKNAPGGGTTLALSIKGLSETLCFNIGDSRIYLYYDGHFKQISIDHSLSWDLYSTGFIKRKDDIRFHKKNNLICASFGDPRHRLTSSYSIMSNDNYDNIMLFSDGITDIIPDSEIEQIVKHSPFEDISDNIMDRCLGNEYYQNYLNLNEYYEKVCGGKDNSSIAIMRKRIRRD